MIFWILVGVVLGYVFKPQLDRLVYGAVKRLRGRNDRNY